MLGLRHSDLSADATPRQTVRMRSDFAFATLVRNVERREAALLWALLLAYAGLVLTLGLGRSHLV